MDLDIYKTADWRINFSFFNLHMPMTAQFVYVMYSSKHNKNSAIG